MSSGVPSRCSGVCEMIRWRDSSSNDSSSGQSIGPGRDRVDAHFGRELARERAREPDQRRLRHRIDDVVLERPLGVDVGDVDDRALRLAQRGRRGLREEQRRAHVGADEVVPVARADLADGRRIERRRVVDQRVEPAERSDSVCSTIAGSLASRADRPGSARPNPARAWLSSACSSRASPADAR